MSLISLLNKYKSIGIITCSLLITTTISFLALPFLSRLYSVEDFGKYGLILSIISVLSTFSSLRLDQAILIADQAEKFSLLISGILIALLISITSFIAISFYKDFHFCIAVAGGVLTNTIFQLFYAYQFSHQHEYLCGLLNIFRNISLILPQLFLPLVLTDSELIFGLYAQSIIISIALVISIIFLSKNNYISISKALNYKDFMLFNSPHALINSFSHNMPYYFLSLFLGSKAVGYYTIVERIMRLPINLMSQVIRQFFVREFSINNANQLSRRKSLKASFIMAIISGPFFLGLIFIPEELYLVILGEQWAGIKTYFVILAWGYWAVFCNPPVSAYIIAKRKSIWLLWFQILEITIKIVLSLIIFLIFGQKIIILISISIALITYNLLNILFIVIKEKKYA